eukprot:SAG11_NODE_187_length_13061_cov_10.715322_5_plen_67_part_00
MGRARLAHEPLIVFGVVVAKSGLWRHNSVKWGEDRRTGKFAGYCHVVFSSAAMANRALKQKVSSAP